MRGKIGLFSLLLITLFPWGLSAQQAFSLEMEEISVPYFPALHSGAWAQHQGKWVFIAGRTNGLHGFLPPLGFPFNGINDQVFVVNPSNWQIDSATVDSLPLSLREATESSNLQFFQEGSTLYLVGGYGWQDSAQDFRTLSTLTAVDLDCLIPAVENGQSINSCFRQINHPDLAICGGHLGKIDSTFLLVWGHRFDGRYDREDTTGFFQQEYSHEVRRFRLDDDGQNLSLTWETPIRDTVHFRRRDYNLSPYIFSNGDHGYVGWSGVFQQGINLPHINPTLIQQNSAQVEMGFDQDLSHYHSAVMPVYDSLDNYFHTFFFGGMAQYYVDSTSQLLEEDSLVPFVKTISQISRDPSGSLSETALSLRMPALLGTNAYFIPDALAPQSGEGIIALNQVASRQRVGFVVGGIESPERNISDTDPSLSWASRRIFEIYLNTNPNARTASASLQEPVSLEISPNPFATELNLQVTAHTGESYALELLNGQGQVLQTLFQGKGSRHLRPSLEVPAGLYFIRLRCRGYRKAYPVLHR